MSLGMFYNGYLAADKKGTINDEVFLDHPVTKLFVSEDRIFAGISCGTILSKKQWDTLYNLFMMADYKDFNLDYKLIDLHEVFEHTDSTCIVYFDKKLYYAKRERTSENKSTYRIYLQDMEYPFFVGNGTSCANYIVNSGKKLPLEKFFRLVSYADITVSREYDFVKLSTMKRRPR